MARPIPPERFEQLVDTATEIFIAQGYRRTQMADVAEAMGLGKGTLYGYVEGKEALFRYVLAHCDHRGPVAVPDRLPLPKPEPGEVVALFDARIMGEASMPVLTRAVGRDRPEDLRQELSEIICELFRVLHRNHRGIRLMESCALDHPELQDRWNAQGRAAYRELLAAYLERRNRSGALRLVSEPSVVARFVIETVTTWAVHIHFDKFPQRISQGAAEAMVVHFITAGLLVASESTGPPPPGAAP
jgi:AcrR family transcriptional regulator